MRICYIIYLFSTGIDTNQTAKAILYESWKVTHVWLLKGFIFVFRSEVWNLDIWCTVYESEVSFVLLHKYIWVSHKDRFIVIASKGHKAFYSMQSADKKAECCFVDYIHRVPNRRIIPPNIIRRNNKEEAGVRGERREEGGGKEG